jgi:hypothetical protein
MKRVRFLLALFLGFGWLSLFAQIPLEESSKSIPLEQLKTPVGIVFNDNSVFVGDLSSVKIYEINKENGKILRTFDPPCFNLTSFCYDGKKFYILDGVEKKVYIYDEESGITLSTLTLDLDSPQSIGFDGKNIWIADGATQTISQIDSSDGTTFKSINSPISKSGRRGELTSITFKDGYLWVSERMRDEVYEMDVDTGWVINIFKAPGPYTSGITFFKDDFVCVDYQKRVVQFIRLPELGKPVRYNPRKETLSFGEKYRNFGPGIIEELNINLALPEKLIFQDIDSKIEISPSNYKIEEDEWGQKCAVFYFKNLKPYDTAEANLKVDCTLYSVSYFLDPKLALKVSDIPDNLKAYLKDDTKLQINDPIIQDGVKEALKGETNSYKIVRKIYNYIQDKMHYEMVGGWNVAPVVLKRGSGSCSEYSFVMIAMLRAAGIPARYAGSVVIRGDDASRDDVFHRWVEAYIPPFDWIPVDPSGGDSDVPVEKAKCFGSLENRFLITTLGGGNSKFLKWDYNSLSSYTSKGAVTLRFLKAGDWMPLIGTRNEKEIQPSSPKSKSCSF